MSWANTSTLPEIMFGTVCADLGRMIVDNDGTVTDLSRREVLILQTLLDADEATVSAQDIYRAAWETRGIPEGRALTFAMRRLRSKIEEDVKNPQYLLTVRGLGFRLVGAIRREKVMPTLSVAPDDIGLRKPRDLFIGRLEERRDIQKFLDTTRPLLTVSGPGGVGKTRLVLEVLSVQDEVPSIVLDLVDCASKMDFLLAFSQRLGMVQQTTTDWESGLKRLVSTLRESSFSTLVLDNVDRCTDAVREMISEAIQEAVSVQFIVTSRSVIRLAEEQVLRLGSLSFQDAKSLFVQRAYRQGEVPKWSVKQREALEEISRELAGCPLAIELAASRLAGLSLQGIRNRLGKQLTMLRRSQLDVHPRQLTLRATLQWSWDLLPLEEQKLLVACSVFCNGFDVPAILSVVDASSSDSLLARIENLVDKSMVIVDATRQESRFSVPNGLRQFVLEQGADGAEIQETVQQCQEAHLRTYAEAAAVALANQYHALTTRQQVEWIQSNIENILSAFRFGLSAGEETFSWKLARVAAMWMRRSQSIPSALDVVREIRVKASEGSVVWLWTGIQMTRIYLSIGHLDRALAVFSDLDTEIQTVSDPVIRQQLWLAQGALHRSQGLYSEARALYKRVEEDGFADVGIRALWQRAVYRLNFSCRDWVAARENLESLLALYREFGAELCEPRVMNDYTHLAGVQGQLAKAYRRAKETLRLAELYEDKQVLRNGLETLALIALKRGELDEAKETFETAFVHRTASGIADYNVNLYINYANVLMLHDQPQEAIQQSRIALSLAQQSKQIPAQVVTLLNLGCLLMDTGEAVEAEFLFRRGIDLAKTIAVSLSGSLLPLVLAVSLFYQDRRAEAELLWAEHWEEVSTLLTVDQVARLWFLRALAEIHVGNQEQAQHYLAEGSKWIEGVSDREIFECVWYRERIQNQLKMGR